MPSVEVSVIVTVCGLDVVTVTPTALSLSVSLRPCILVCEAVPKRGINAGLLAIDVPKLKSLSAGFVFGADCCNTCVLFKNTSFKAATL